MKSCCRFRVESRMKRFTGNHHRACCAWLRRACVPSIFVPLIFDILRPLISRKSPYFSHSEGSVRDDWSCRIYVIDTMMLSSSIDYPPRRQRTTSPYVVSYRLTFTVPFFSQHLSRRPLGPRDIHLGQRRQLGRTVSGPVSPRALSSTPFVRGVESQAAEQ